jgi:hypothetical protein
MRFVFGLILALSVGIGAYFGSAQVASSAAQPDSLTTGSSASSTSPWVSPPDSPLLAYRVTGGIASSLRHSPLTAQSKRRSRFVVGFEGEES